METNDFPSLHVAADEKSADEQQKYISLQAAELVSIVSAALFAELSWRSGDINVAASISFVLLLAALASRLLVLALRVEKNWYDARAVAESAKTLAWQYAVGGSAFPKTSSKHEMQQTYLANLAKLIYSFPKLDVPARQGKNAQISAAMELLRSSPLDERQRTYLNERVLDQQDWYAKKARWNRVRARYWAGALITLEASAALLGLLRGLGVLDIDLAGILATAAAAVVAWRQAKQYTTLAEAYSTTSHDVAAVADGLQVQIDDEHEWAERVHDAEAAFSREHTMWLARRQHA